MADIEIERVRAVLAANPRPPGLAQRRERLDARGAQSVIPADVRLEALDAGGVAAEWSSTPGADAQRVILYAHGGGYIAGSIVSHRAMVVEAGRQARARTLALDYRRPPEHPFPAAVDDVLAAYRFLLAKGIEPQNVVMAGDSAGGGLTLAMMVSLRDAGLPLPGCAWCISPWVDLEQSGGSMTTKAAVDPMIQKPYLDDLAGQYLAGANPRDPLASPLYADLHGLPPTLIQVGSAETLLDDAIRLAGALGDADVAVTLDVYPDMIHVWHLLFENVTVGRRALAAAGLYIRATLEAR